MGETLTSQVCNAFFKVSIPINSEGLDTEIASRFSNSLEIRHFQKSFGQTQSGLLGELYPIDGSSL